MTNSSMSFGRPTRLAIPRSSIWLASLATAMIHGLRRLDRWLLSQRQDNPKTAAELMAWADRIEHNEPSFAADLRGAALRSMSDPDRG